MSYWIRISVQKNGIASQATLKLKDRAFNELNIDRIEIDVGCCNEASKKVALKIGGKADRYIRIPGGDNKSHDGTKYVINNPKST